MDRKLDPRTIVTPYAFAVHPELLGIPLATPWRRFGAIAVDLVVIGFLSLVGFRLSAIASMALLFWLATRKPRRDTAGKVFKFAAGCLGVTVLGITALVIFLNNYEPVQDIIEEVRTQVEAGSQGTPTGGGDEAADADPGLVEMVQGVAGAFTLQSAETAQEAQAMINAFAQGSFAAGMSRGEIRETVRDIIPEDAAWAPNADEILAGAMATLPGATQETQATPTPGDSGDAEEANTFSAAAVDHIEGLNQELVEEREHRDDLQDALDRTTEALNEERDRNQGPFSWILGILDDIGVGSMWAVIYLTVTHAWWKGRSIGKKFFGIRVVMIDKRPLNWWLSFERVGGYAAGLATGLLGFAQVFWDPNRQAIHDKVSETIVIREGKAPVPGPWIQEGKDQWTKGHQHLPEKKPKQ